MTPAPPQDQDGGRRVLCRVGLAKIVPRAERREMPGESQARFRSEGTNVKQAKAFPNSQTSSWSVSLLHGASKGDPSADGPLPRRHNEHPQALCGGYLEHDQR